MKMYRIGVLLVFVVVLAGCDADVFGTSTRDIVGSYELKQHEDFETYYLYGPQETGWGVIDGTFEKIGWNSRYILVLQHDDGNGGDWRIIDTKSNSISPLLTKTQVEINRDVGGIETYSASVAWHKL